MATTIHKAFNFESIMAPGLLLHAKAGIAVARLNHRNCVHLSVTRVDQSKMGQAKIIKSSPSAAWNTLVLETVKFFHKFEGGHLERWRLMRRGWEKFVIFSQ